MGGVRVKSQIQSRSLLYILLCFDVKLVQNSLYKNKYIILRQNLQVLRIGPEHIFSLHHVLLYIVCFLNLLYY